MQEEVKKANGAKVKWGIGGLVIGVAVMALGASL
jgi:hypothetical protein